MSGQAKPIPYAAIYLIYRSIEVGANVKMDGVGSNEKAVSCCNL